MGFISIFGIAIQDAILVVSHFQRIRAPEEEGGPPEPVGIREAALDASAKRLRPALMTSLVALFGLLPAALSHGIGSETQKPLAVVVIGGALVLAVVARLVQTPLLILIHEVLERRRTRARSDALET
jgi:cobalt-zinc-cadmium resistance protein CzcA